MAQSGREQRRRGRSSPRPTTARSPRSSARSSRTTSSAAGSPAWSPPAASSSASTWARSTSSSRSSRRPASPAPCSASAAPATRSARCRRGVLFPKHRGDLAQTAVAVERMRSGADRVAARCPTNPLDVLAQQVVATTALDAVDGRRPVRRSCAAARRSPSCRARRLRRHARPAQRPLPLRRVRRAAPAHRLGPRHRHPHRPARRPAARGHQRRHHPRPRAVRGLPRRRRGPGPAGRRARRGDGLRVPGRRRLRPRRDQLADRGHHPRPGAGHARAGHPGPAAVLEGRRPRPARRARRGHRRVHPRARPRCRATQADGARPRGAASTT